MTRTFIRFVALIMLAGLVGGCVTSPFYAQIFNSKTTQIPFEIWTLNSTQNFTLECALASAHGGPFNGDGSYQPLTTMTPSTSKHYDYKGSTVFHGAKLVVIPNDCWRNYSYPDGTNWITVVRITQGSNGDKGIFTYDKAGLECLGKWVGKNGLPAGGGGSIGCHMKWINTGQPIKTVFLKAK